MESPPDNDVCSVCHDNFSLPCQANCSHWFCGQCILRVWHHGSALQACKCPICRRFITLLVPSEATQRQRHDPEASRVLENIEKYNRLFGGGSNSLWQVYSFAASERLVAYPFKLYLDDDLDYFDLSETPGTLISFLDEAKPMFKEWVRSHGSEYLASRFIKLYGNIQVQLDFEHETLLEGLKRGYKREQELAAQVVKLRERIFATEAKLGRSKEEEVHLLEDFKMKYEALVASTEAEKATMRKALDKSDSLIETLNQHALQASGRIGEDQSEELQDVRNELKAARRRIKDLETLMKSLEEENARMKHRNWELTEETSRMILSDKQNHSLFNKTQTEKIQLKRRVDEQDAMVKRLQGELDDMTAECLRLRQATGPARGPEHHRCGSLH